MMLSRDEQVSPPAIHIMDLYAYEELSDTDDVIESIDIDDEMTDVETDTDETISEVYSPVVSDDEL